MSAGEDDHPMSWCFAFFPREGMAGTYRHLRESWWGKPENWPDGVRRIVAEYRPHQRACQECRERYARRDS